MLIKLTKMIFFFTDHLISAIWSFLQNVFTENADDFQTLNFRSFLGRHPRLGELSDFTRKQKKINCT